VSDEPPSPRDPADSPALEQPPPILGSWRRAYALILIELGVTVLALYALARWAQ
jgi:hypothetical protein